MQNRTFLPLPLFPNFSPPLLRYLYSLKLVDLLPPHINSAPTLSPVPLPKVLLQCKLPFYLDGKLPPYILVGILTKITLPLINQDISFILLLL